MSEHGFLHYNTIDANDLHQSLHYLLLVILFEKLDHPKFSAVPCEANLDHLKHEQLSEYIMMNKSLAVTAANKRCMYKRQDYRQLQTTNIFLNCSTADISTRTMDHVHANTVVACGCKET